MPDPHRDPREGRELARAVAAGDPEAARELCETYLPRLYSYVLGRSGLDEDQAAEVAQETLVAALRSAQHFRGESGLYTWLCSIARRKVADHYRRERRRPLSLDAITSGGLAVIDSRPLPEEVVARRETAEAVHRVVWELPARQREAVLEKYLDERPVTEIARRLGKSEKAVESLLSRGRANLRRRFAELGRAGQSSPGKGGKAGKNQNPTGDKTSAATRSKTKRRIESSTQRGEER